MTVAWNFMDHRRYAGLLPCSSRPSDECGDDRRRSADRNEIRLRRYERHPDTVAGRIAQRHKRFQGGDTAAHDHHLGRRPELGHGLTPRLSRAVVNGPTDESAACAATVFSHEMA